MDVTIAMDPNSAHADQPRRFKLAGQGAPEQADDAVQPVTRLVGLGPMTNVKTAFGEYPAQTLRENDRIMVREGGFRPIKSLKRMTFDEEYLRYHPGAQPIVIRANAFSPVCPNKDLILAPDQRVAANATNLPLRLERAIDLITRPHVLRKPEQIITYTVISLGRPAFIQCNGVWVELTS